MQCNGMDNVVPNFTIESRVLPFTFEKRLRLLFTDFIREVTKLISRRKNINYSYLLVRLKQVAIVVVA